MPRQFRSDMTIIESVGPNAPTVINESGGKQSKCEFAITQIPPLILLDVAKVLQEGSEKYGIDNQYLIPKDEHLNHALIHIFAYLAGDKTDNHLTHAICRLLFATEINRRK